MSSFSDELRNLIAKKAEQLDVADALRQRAAREEERKENELWEAAARVVRDVFRPLVAEFHQALVAAGLFGQGKGAALETHVNGAAACVLWAQGQARSYHIRFYTAVTAAGRIELAATCRPVADRRGMPQPAAEDERPEPEAAWKHVFDDTPNITDSKDSPDDAAATDLLGGPWSPPPSSPPRAPFVDIPPKSIAPDPASLAAEQWCRDALKKIVEACVAAERGN